MRTVVYDRVFATPRSGLDLFQNRFVAILSAWAGNQENGWHAIRSLWTGDRAREAQRVEEVQGETHYYVLRTN
jgi:hypothetical protein